ncbi:hypothetical protein [Actinomadura parmotrematis]|uniref:Nuclear transport factor 2 family protein n=1 Tax=Actinomadura parmotrematis TaxID=2864039 RepID=A0ABS7FNS3_9ACTN|nr:hypothetical protein [Actinomadura parmotrematis]MBW8481434.1 hypothetical protein [Actinomadura parmotrematis]
MALRRTAPPAAALLFAAGCSLPPPASGALQPSGTNGAAATVRGSAAADGTPVLDAYRRFHEVFEYSLATGDAGRVRQAATGAAAARLLTALRANRRAGVVQRGHSVPHPQLRAARAASADVVDCVTTSGLWTYRAATGARVGRAPKAGRYLLYARLVRAKGAWKVALVTYPEDPRC